MGLTKHFFFLQTLGAATRTQPTINGVAKRTIPAATPKTATIRQPAVRRPPMAGAATPSKSTVSHQTPTKSGLSKPAYRKTPTKSVAGGSGSGSGSGLGLHPPPAAVYNKSPFKFTGTFELQMKTPPRASMGGGGGNSNALQAAPSAVINTNSGTPQESLTAGNLNRKQVRWFDDDGDAI